MKWTVIIRELSKLILVVFYWVFPIWMWQQSGSSGYLLLFIVSLLLTGFTFTHYEILEEAERDTPKKLSVEDLYPKKEE